MKKKIKAGIIGGAGYTGGELIRILLNHPEAEIAFAVSKSQAGKKITDVHSDLIGETDLVFSAEAEKGADVVFLCLPHGESKSYLQSHHFFFNPKIIDLSRDFRIKNSELGMQNFEYGLPELNWEKIRLANYIANPGCFATAIQLGLLPLAAKGFLKGDIHVNATTGSTGAGHSLSEATNFNWRNNNLSAYKILEHDHLPEIGQSLLQLQGDFSGQINFIPQRGTFTRGILAATTVKCDVDQEEAEDLYSSYYRDHPFVHLVEQVNIKQVINTNKCFIQLVKHKEQLAIISVLDNLLKGASGQAVQNMNLMFGLDEKAGLQLKANVY